MSPDWSMPTARCHDHMIRLMAEKVQKVSERVGFPSGNIQIDPVKSAWKKCRSPEKRTKLNTSPPMIPLWGISRKKCCGNIAWNCAHRRNRNTPDHRDRKITGQSFPCQLLTALQIFSHNSVSLRYRRRRLIKPPPRHFLLQINHILIFHMFSLRSRIMPHSWHVRHLSRNENRHTNLRCCDHIDVHTLIVRLFRTFLQQLPGLLIIYFTDHES